MRLTYFWILEIHILISICVYDVCAPKVIPLPTQAPYRKYIPPLIEKRVWTNTFSEPISLEPRIPHRFMQLTLRDFSTNCDGHCIYHKGDSKTPTEAQCSPKLKECHLSASIAEHDPDTTCPLIGRGYGNINKTLCNKGDVIYSVSLIRSVKNTKSPSCKTYWDFDKKMPCFPTEFVAIQFIDPKPTTSPKHAEKFWYVCVAGETTVTYWENEDQKLYTQPVYGTAPGVVATTYLTLDLETRTLACQFLISAAKLYENTLIDSKFNKSNSNIVHIRMAQGRVTREETLKVPEALDGLGNSKQDYDENLLRTKEVSEYFKRQKVVLHPNFFSTEPDDETIVTDQFVGPGLSSPGPAVIDILNIQITKVQLVATIPDEEHKRNEALINKAIERCEGPGVKCFSPGKYRNCLYRKACFVMAIVEPVRNSKLTKLRFTLIHFIRHPPYQKQAIRPFGYASIGFSNDAKMGGDAVVTCKITGDSRAILVAYNQVNNNRVNLAANQGIVFDREDIIAVQYQTADKIMCSWKMNAKFTIETSIAYKGGTEEGYESFDLMQPSSKGGIYVLLATGSQVYPDSSAGYHSFRTIIRNPLMNRDGFNSAIHTTFSTSFIIILSVAVILIHVFY